MTLPEQSTRLGIFFIIVGMLAISANDMLIKQLSGDYPLHQMVFVRSSVGIIFSIAILHLEGGWHLLRTRRVLLHCLRGTAVILANLTYFAALAVMPLADATAMFFVAPLFITVLSIPILGEIVGLRRLGAVVVGFAGVLVMLRPGFGSQQESVPILVLLLPVLAAFFYAIFQIMTRLLGPESKASAMAVYVQAMFIVVSLSFYVLAGDGRYAQNTENEVLVFLLRAWAWPTPADWPYFLFLGFLAAMIGYALSQAYRLANAATIAPFEYTGMPMAIFWGWIVFGTLPDIWVWAGVLLISLSGLYVFLRERAQNRAITREALVRR